MQIYLYGQTSWLEYRCVDPAADLYIHINENKILKSKVIRTFSMRQCNSGYLPLFMNMIPFDPAFN